MWSPFLEAVERRLGKQAVATWFRPLRVADSAIPGVLNVAAPNAVVRDWILSNYSQALNESLSELSPDPCRIEWIVPRFQDRDDGTRNSASSPLIASAPLESKMGASPLWMEDK